MEVIEIVKESFSNHLVDRVMSTYIFANKQQIFVVVKQEELHDYHH